MNDKAEKVYGEAFFELCMEECPDKASDIFEELSALDGVFADSPELVKLMGTPTVSAEEKAELINEIISGGNVSELCGNLLCVLAERGRFGCFAGIVKNFRARYNEHFKIAEITVTSNAPLSDMLKERIISKMSEVTGKKISVREKVDPSVIGGIVIDYGSTRYDGSVKARLNALRQELSSVIT